MKIKTQTKRMHVVSCTRSSFNKVQSNSLQYNSFQNITQSFFFITGIFILIPFDLRKRVAFYYKASAVSTTHY